MVPLTRFQKSHHSVTRFSVVQGNHPLFGDFVSSTRFVFTYLLYTSLKIIGPLILSRSPFLVPSFLVEEDIYFLRLHSYENRREEGHLITLV